MKHTLWLLAVPVSLAALSGCRRQETVLPTPGGVVRTTHEGDSQTTTISGPQGEAKVTASDDRVEVRTRDASGKEVQMTAENRVDPAALGVAIYPGAKPIDDKSQVKVEGSEGTSITAGFRTPDAVDKVSAFYTKELKAQQTFTSPEGGVVAGTNSAGDTVSVMIAKGQDGAGTQFVLSIQKKKK